MRALLSDRRFRLFWLGQATSTVGNGIRIVALASLILDRHDGQVLGLVLAADALATAVVLLAGGVLADRYSRTTVMATGDLVRALAAAGFVLLAGSPAQLIVLAVASGIGTALFQPAHRAAIPQLVAEPLRKQANALESATNQIGLAVGAALGGALVAAQSARFALLIDAATFLVSLGTLVLIRLPRVGGETAGGLAATLHEARDGIRAVLAKPWVGVTILQGTVQVAFAFAPTWVLLPIVAQDRYGDGAYGWLVTAQFAGMVSGSTLAARLRVRREGLVAMHGIAASALTGGCLAVPVALPVFALAQFIAWLGVGVFVVFWVTALQRAYPPQLQGRVWSLEQVTTFALEPVALAAAPAVALAVGIPAIGVTAAIVLVVASYAILIVPGVAEFRSPGSPEPEP
ncbi:MAG: MFS transporter, partial [Sporichthyaceae bacterium]|nr:MFS transporter [Sporichthyaceae bacterium]